MSRTLGEARENEYPGGFAAMAGATGQARKMKCSSVKQKWMVWASGCLLAGLAGMTQAAWDDARGLERLSPVRLYAVPEPKPLAAQALPPEGEPLDAPADTAPGTLDVYGLTWQPTPKPQARGSAQNSAASGAGANRRQLAGRLGLQTEGMARWIYRGSEGPDVAFGVLPGSGLKISGSAPIAGVRLQSGGMEDAALLDSGVVGYSSAVGWLDYSPWTAGTGAVEYGVSAGQTAVRYGWRPDLTLEGQVQTAAKMRNVGLGGVYSLGEWGRLRAGAAHSRYENVEGSRYNLGYVVSLYDWLEVGYRAEYAMSGYSDLSRYASGPLSQARVQGTLETGVPLAGWGTISGTYSDVRYGNTTVQRMGIAHSLALRRNVQLKWEADRDIVSGDYGMRLNLSLPVNLLGD
ncbi:hypothetical protein EV679_3083 [Kerstersia gyiorum]|uniref:Rhodanese domain-containing protein n=2 Tax=Kerstersia gyiorum TaxID=206506 RepID=A0A4Q7MBI6_9BURK|nr:hypothetical protein [Kerstersia gyiorum]QBR39718.1 hypothetical protein EHF36_02985 [Kerstersia gyiorum]RZS65294.1 hypothetical protein EV679_3083 [Kerstersia gyiorum]